ncbi:hypothetical protein BH11PLA2_BH11PLA2_27530 [soil metagenome]
MKTRILTTAFMFMTTFVFGRAEDTKPLRTIDTPGESNWLAITPDSQYLLSANEVGNQRGGVGELRLWEIATGKLVAGPVKTVGVTASGAISPDSTKAATGDFTGNWRLCDLKDLKEIEQGNLGSGRVDRIAFAPDSQQFVMLRADYRKKLFDPIKAGRVTYFLYSHSATDGKPAGKSLPWPRVLPAGDTATDPHISDPADWTFAVGPAFDKEGQPVVPTAKTVEVLEVPSDEGVCGGVMAFAISPDRKLAASAGCNGTAVVWDYQARTVIGKPLPIGDRTHCAQRLVFSADSRLLAVACTDGVEQGGSLVSIVEVKTRAILAGPFKTARLDVASNMSFAFTPDGSTLAVMNNIRGEKPANGIQLWAVPVAK